jgi:hypothetical protein
MGMGSQKSINELIQNQNHTTTAHLKVSPCRKLITYLFRAGLLNGRHLTKTTLTVVASGFKRQDHPSPVSIRHFNSMLLYL